MRMITKSWVGSSLWQPWEGNPPFVVHPPIRDWAPWVITGWSENSWSQSDTDPWEACAKVGGKGSGSPNLLTQPMCTPPNGRTA